jgi:uncharacterized protein (TIGR02421 family)
MDTKAIEATLSKVASGISAIGSNTNLLDDVAWPRETEERFFASGASQLPVAPHRVDRKALDDEIAALKALDRAIEGEGPIVHWLRGTIGSYVDRARLLLAVGTREFGVRSREIFGGAKTSFFGLPLCNLDLARHLGERLTMHGTDAAHDPDEEILDASGMVSFLETRIAKRKAPVKVVIDPACSSKVIAGMKRVRVRPDATFTPWEAEGLYRHEVETHAYSALNGADQKLAPFLKSGGPRSTPTQEGLAVFAELYHHALAVPRLLRLALRVEMVAMAEDGASFLDVYRFLTKTHGIHERDAFLDAARIFRGGLVEGGAPFTKDACYLAGLVEVSSFLAAFVRAGFRDECEMLVAGRFSLEDFAALAQLRNMGLLSRPRWRPRWLRDWGTLLPHFAFSSFVEGIDMKPVEARYAEAIRVANVGRSADK